MHAMERSRRFWLSQVAGVPHVACHDTSMTCQSAIDLDSIAGVWRFSAAHTTLALSAHLASISHPHTFSSILHLQFAW
jgi:hypothetical protein